MPKLWCPLGSRCSTAASAAASMRLIITGVANTAILPEPTNGAVCSGPTTISAVPVRPGTIRSKKVRAPSGEGIRLYSANSRHRAKRLPSCAMMAMQHPKGLKHVSLCAFGGCFDRVDAGGAMFRGRCEAENGNLQIRRGRPETARRGARCFHQEVYGESERSARAGLRRRRRAQAAIAHDPEKWMPVFGKDRSQTSMIKGNGTMPF